ncbi:MAG: 16S rRNA (adenine(1518)-N(6)/adenine(1519)-N(6))-dimethyltransferase RsmA [Armatimonadota bacterium]
MSRRLRQRTEALLRQHGLRPLKRLGQHFLVDEGVGRDIVEAAGIGPQDCVLEIGPGAGALTELLAARARRVVAVEVDRGLAAALADHAQSWGVELLHADFLELDLAETCADGRWVLVGNLPYYITTPLLERAFEQAGRWRLAVVTVQEEVAERLLAEPGSRQYGALTLFARYHAEVEVVRRVPPQAFYPSPGVHSTVLRLRFAGPTVDADREALLAVTRGALAQRRKTVLNSLAGSGRIGLDREDLRAALADAGIEPGRRGETLSLEEFAALARALTARCGHDWPARAPGREESLSWSCGRTPS